MKIHFIDEQFLKEHPEIVFVYGDNINRKGKKGAAILRDYKNTYGFITKKLPSNSDHSFFTKVEYAPILVAEIEKLENEIKNNPDLQYYISAVGSGLANRYDIWNMIKPELLKLKKKYKNVELLFTEDFNE